MDVRKLAAPDDDGIAKVPCNRTESSENCSQTNSRLTPTEKAEESIEASIKRNFKLLSTSELLSIIRNDSGAPLKHRSIILRLSIKYA